MSKGSQSLSRGGGYYAMPVHTHWLGYRLQAGLMLLVILVHGAAGFALLQPRDLPPPAAVTRYSVKLISLGLSSAMAGAKTANRTVTPAVAATAPPREAMPETKALPQTKKATQQTPKATQQTKVKPPVLARRSASSIPTPAQPVTKPVLKDKPAPAAPSTAVPPPSPRASASATMSRAAAAGAKAGQQGKTGAHVSHNKQADTGQSAQRGGQANPASHDLKVRQHLLSHQRIPKVLGSRRAGEVVVEFVIDRHGQLIKQLMGKSSGIREFDRAARQMVQEAAPYPDAPTDLHWQQRLYRITVRYEVQ
jgi:TonB family protein